LVTLIAAHNANLDYARCLSIQMRGMVAYLVSFLKIKKGKSYLRLLSSTVKVFLKFILTKSAWQHVG
jgi:hypothetical protein